MNSKTKPENFYLSSEFLSAIDLTEIDATFDAMVECDLDRAPYSEFYITCPEAVVIKITGEEPKVDHNKLLEFHFTGLDQPLRNAASGAIPNSDVKVISWYGKKNSLEWFKVLPKALPTQPELVKQLAEKLMLAGATLVQVLVVSLATRAVQKSRTENKLAKLGIGKGRTAKYSYTTTISAPGTAGIETDPTNSSGTVRPHLRRGHVRAQPFGPNNSLRKKVFIEPVFVNSDKEFVSFRDHYNISIKPESIQ